MEKSATHHIYSDESCFNSKTYASICLISLDLRILEGLNSDLEKISLSSGINEIKWCNIRGARDRLCAIKIVDYIFKMLKFSPFRIDVVTWDIQERNNKFEDNDIDSLKKMYFQILKNVMKERWESQIVWNIFPDTQNNLDWKESQQILENVSLRLILKENEIEFKKDFNIAEIKEVNSKEHPLVQVADLFAGIGTFSNIYKKGLPIQKNQTTLFETNTKKITNSETEKIEVFNHFLKKCSGSNINLRSKFPLESWPTDKINFWNFKFRDNQNSALKI